LESSYTFIGTSEKCSFDAVIVFDGSYLNSNNSQDFDIFCGNLNKKLPEFISKTNTIYVQFVTDSAGGYEGFEAEITFTYGRVLYFLFFPILSLKIKLLTAIRDFFKLLCFIYV